MTHDSIEPDVEQMSGPNQDLDQKSEQQNVAAQAPAGAGAGRGRANTVLR